MNVASNAVYISHRLKRTPGGAVVGGCQIVRGPRKRFQCEVRHPAQSHRSKAHCVKQRPQRPGLVGIFNRFPRETAVCCDQKAVEYRKELCRVFIHDPWNTVNYGFMIH